MVELVSLNMVVDRLEHGCSCMLEQTVHRLMNEQTSTTLLEPS